MDDDLASRWEQALTDLREAYLRQLELKADGSAHPDRLAWRAVVQADLPGRVSCVKTEGAQLCRVEPAGRTFAFERQLLDPRAALLVAKLRAGQPIASMAMGDGAVWFVQRETDPPDRFRLEDALGHELQLRVDAELARRRALEATTFDAIGWRDAPLPVPQGPPDERVRMISRSTGSDGIIGSRRLRPRDLVQDMERSTRTLVVVPDAVDELVQMVRLLYVRGWHQWEFFTLASREGYVALEASLRLLDAEERGRLDQRASFKALVDRVGTRDQARPLLSDWERERAHSMRERRNDLIHPTMGQTIEWISWTRQSIQDAVRLINLMWARWGATVPVELAWERPSPP